jgi:hypothetical protein
VLLQALLLGLAFGAGGADPATLGIFVDFEHTPSAASVEAMYSELKALLAPAGIAPIWRQLRGSTGNEEFDRILIVRFKGVCRAGTRVESPLSGDLFGDEMRLAHTKVAKGQVLPLAEVECDNVRKGVAKAPMKERQTMLGFLLGRVVAHELYHLLRQTVNHQRSGLAKAVLNWKELSQGNFASSLLRHGTTH